FSRGGEFWWWSANKCGTERPFCGKIHRRWQLRVGKTPRRCSQRSGRCCGRRRQWQCPYERILRGDGRLRRRTNDELRWGRQRVRGEVLGGHRRIPLVEGVYPN